LRKSGADARFLVAAAIYGHSQEWIIRVDSSRMGVARKRPESSVRSSAHVDRMLVDGERVRRRYSIGGLFPTYLQRDLHLSPGLVEAGSGIEPLYADLQSAA
jgi:hypothetical protein